MCAFFNVFSHKYGLSWWPSHGAAAKHVHVEVIHALRSQLAVVDDDAKAVVQLFLFGNAASHHHQVAEELRRQEGHRWSETMRETLGHGAGCRPGDGWS